MEAKNNGRFRKGRSGNPAGRPPGSRNRATLAMETLLEGEAEGLMRTAIDWALAGDIRTLRLCLERLMPPRKERLIHVDAGPIQNATQAADAVNTVICAVGAGEITPGEGESLVNMITAQVAVLSTADIARRVQELEESTQRLAEQLAKKGAGNAG
jgi:hypothetical protein